jgi:hypothetical protein
MVLTDDGTNMVWYSNNRLVFSTTHSAVGFIQNGINGDPGVAGGPTTLAIRSDGAFGGWDGGMEDVAVYNYVLSPQQIQNHFQNTTHLTAVGSGNSITFNWPVGTLQSATNVSGPYVNVIGATPPSYSTSMTSPHVFYRVSIAQ